MTGEQRSLSALVTAVATVLEPLDDAVFMIDLDGCLLFANGVLRAALTLDLDTAVGHPFDPASHSIDRELSARHMARAQAGESVRYHGVGSRPDGSPFATEVALVPIRVAGTIAGVLGIARDITADDETAWESRESEELLRFAGKLARFGGWSMDARTRRIEMSHDTRRMFGLPGLPDITDLAWGLHPPAERERMAATLEACLTHGIAFDVESVMITTSGRAIHVRTIGEAERDSDGTILRAHGAVWDISEQVAARERERDLEERLSTTLTTISDGIVFLDLDWRITFVNPRAVRMLGRTEEEMVGHIAWDLFPAVLKSGFYTAFAQALASLEKSSYRGFYAETGRWFDATAYPTPTGLAVYLRDVTSEETARIDAERAQQRIAHQAALLDIARDAIIVRDLDNRIEYWNKAAEDIYGWTAEEAIGRGAHELLYDDREALDAATRDVLRDGYFIGEIEQRHRSGRRIIADCRWQLVLDDEGVPRSIMAVNSDITDYRREQEERARAERLESLGTLAGGIAHDLNNVLTPILMSVQLLEHDEHDEGKLELLSTVETAVKRGAEMVRQVLSFARGVDGRRIPVDLDRMLDDVVSYARESLPTGIELEIDRPPRLPGTVGDPTQLLQVFINLVSNARDALQGTGALRLRARLAEFDEPFTTVSHEVRPGPYALISVEDTGEGMAPEVVAKVFEPFFTTKEQGRGTGLGLATSLAIVRSHGGFVQVESELGHGTRFDIGVPATSVPDGDTRSDRPSADDLPRGIGELILVADDEAAILQVCRQTLEAHGYRTLGASNGREAIAIIESEGTAVDLLLTDMMMPVMDGAETSAYLEEHHPEIPIIAASGLNAHGDVSDSIGMGISRFLPKPYATSVLLKAVRDTLDERRESFQGDGDERMTP